ncbi:protein kinase, putative [Talaromyces stipitatus ATCC 10500]|uniref:Protein kinase, putative n=1 Tax=Talaromyces stipitatus (strain ATCC 10500 / CBS 375.48 / QM 6759 / NRRL 1006) TaxID=441959 RepID=B8MH86_TALSN|nr:protein kinase, putative [Talaromyces stipitatus ATCC 10500]EED17065.1 protein kinase, putative [Talaromyces stipitatus ATCC 10500]
MAQMQGALYPIPPATQSVSAFLLQRLFLVLDYLHTECQIIHTDEYRTLIICYFTYKTLLDIKADNIMFGIADDSVFSDFENEELQKHSEDVQPGIYRAPEVILEAPWTYSIDVWNVGCMIWNVSEGETLFTGQDPEYQTYRSRYHFSEMISLLGNLLPRIPLKSAASLEERESTLGGEDKASLLRLLRRMLQ